jgi:histidine ammonia-lyase
LQDPLTFRGLPQLHGALRDAIAYARDRLSIELNAAQGNPMVSRATGRPVSVGNFDILPLAAAVDLLRVALAPLVTASAERSVKLLMKPWSGLPPGLMPIDGSPESGLGELSVAVVSLAAEARLLAQPVSFELPSTTIAEGIEDRMTMAPLGAHRLGDMVGLGRRVGAVELVIAGQAVELRGLSQLGHGTARALQLLRQRVPFVHNASEFPADLEPVIELVASGELSPLTPD